jgi:insulysin
LKHFIVLGYPYLIFFFDCVLFSDSLTRLNFIPCLSLLNSFLGSEKYPGENEYKRYLSAHGGRSNASTSMHLTNYKFEVLADRAEKAVDIFSNFFVAPLFTSSGTGREVQAVDSENSRNLTDDSRRRLQVLKNLADPEHHYYSKFSTGNSITLPTDDPEKLNWIREALLAFHKKHYTPENMTVVIAGPQSLDTLQGWIVPRYSAIGSKEFPESEDKMSPVERLVAQGAKDAPFYAHFQPEPPYHSAFNPSLQGGSWPVLLTTKPLRSMRKLVMMFPMPSDRRVPDKSPASVLSHLLGHEGPGSAFAVLQNHGMLSSLSAGPRTRAPDFNLFQIEMELTEKGETQWMEVVDLIFAYCRLVTGQAVAQSKDFDDPKRIWGEVSKLSAMFFDLTSPSGVYSYAPNLAERVVAYGTETCLSAGSMLNESDETFPRDQVLHASRLLVPTNCIVERCSQAAWDQAQMNSARSDHAGVFGKRTEKWYGVEYYLSRIDNKVIQAWEGSKGLLDNGIDWGEVGLPRPNRYIPRTLELCPELAEEAKTGPHIEKEIEPPNLLIDDDSGRLFHRIDDRYALPQSSLTFLIRNGAAHYRKSGAGDWEFDQMGAILSAIISSSFNQAMAQETYDADLAGLYWSVGLGSAGIKLSFFGFSDRLPDLALKILREFLSGDYIQASYFDTSKDRIVRGYRTFFESRRADSHAIYYRDALLASKDNGVDEALTFAEAATLQSVIDQHKRIVANDEISIDCLFTGNVSPGDAKKFYVEANKTIQQTRGASSIPPSSEPSFPGKSKCNSRMESISTQAESHFSLHPASFFERRLPPGEDIELHFASKNPEEENGAVVVTYQSPIPSFKGEEISHPEGLKSTSAIRLICHMLREPLFDELRTKQTLGYVVSSYFELGYSTRIHPGSVTVPIDFITINVLSRKLSPPEIANRIDEFLDRFRESLQGMPESEIQSHADALSSKSIQLFGGKECCVSTRSVHTSCSLSLLHNLYSYALKANTKASK